MLGHNHYNENWDYVRMFFGHNLPTGSCEAVIIPMGIVTSSNVGIKSSKTEILQTNCYFFYLLRIGRILASHKFMKQIRATLINSTV